MPAPAQLGPYRIGEPLGKGGMGTVYRAVNAETNEQVAVKTLAPELAASEGFRDRFEAEIESLRKLRHPNIVRLYGYGEEDGVLFYSMELVDGVSLEEELRRGRRFDWREVTRIAVQVSRALKHAHDHGIIHRDIKPANILQSGDKVMLADFGIAQLFGGAKLTTARGVVGTADFMSPEQAEGRPITDRCDQYSLGCVMYALLAGRPPFRAKGLPEMLQLQRYAEPEPVRRFAPDTPKQLEKVVMQLLEKSPKERFPNAMALAKHLEAMSLAFSRPKIIESDFQVQHEEEPGLAPIDDLAETPADVSKAPDAESLDYETLAPPTRGPSDVSVAERSDSTQAPLAIAPAERKFTVVSDEPIGGDDHRPLWLSLLQGALLLLIIVGIGAALVWGMRPQSADALYEQIMTAAAEGEDELASQEQLIEQFLQRFPDDPRRAEIEPLSQQVAFAQAQRRMMAMLRRRAASDAPLESLYLEAMREAKDNPEQSLRQLDAVAKLMSAEDSAGHSEGVQAMLLLIEQQAEQLQERIARRASKQLPFLQSRMETAESLTDQDPAAAREVCDAIIRLYADRPWASEVVADARRLLSQLDAKD